ncbi:hypothetical protein N7447_009276 [Penicillium robsamsonii]|uniref:uncharacterized protein n=1 Tax=Penicillium robsamsonii TaxID=1792511 RepID=UPI00254850AF|nr:uncharacterized protein N7447_009276 [Penicillium robsamsonii]KAJ5817043.1 hypothetical protein N7447_009276 [Penicillium robsamsonii]
MAIYETIQGDITLFHAICAMYLLTMLAMDALNIILDAALTRWQGNISIMLYLLAVFYWNKLSIVITSTPKRGNGRLDRLLRFSYYEVGFEAC